MRLASLSSDPGSEGGGGGGGPQQVVEQVCSLFTLVVGVLSCVNWKLYSVKTHSLYFITHLLGCVSIIFYYYLLVFHFVIV